MMPNKGKQVGIKTNRWEATTRHDGGNKDLWKKTFLLLLLLLLPPLEVIAHATRIVVDDDIIRRDVI